MLEWEVDFITFMLSDVFEDTAWMKQVPWEDMKSFNYGNYIEIPRDRFILCLKEIGLNSDIPYVVEGSKLALSLIENSENSAAESNLVEAYMEGIKNNFVDYILGHVDSKDNKGIIT